MLHIKNLGVIKLLQLEKTTVDGKRRMLLFVKCLLEEKDNEETAGKILEYLFSMGLEGKYELIITEKAKGGSQFKNRVRATALSSHGNSVEVIFQFGNRASCKKAFLWPGENTLPAHKLLEAFISAQKTEQQYIESESFIQHYTENPKEYKTKHPDFVLGFLGLQKSIYVGVETIETFVPSKHQGDFKNSYCKEIFHEDGASTMGYILKTAALVEVFKNESPEKRAALIAAIGALLKESAQEDHALYIHFFEKKLQICSALKEVETNTTWLKKRINSLKEELAAAESEAKKLQENLISTNDTLDRINDVRDAIEDGLREPQNKEIIGYCSLFD